MTLNKTESVFVPIIRGCQDVNWLFDLIATHPQHQCPLPTGFHWHRALLCWLGYFPSFMRRKISGSTPRLRWFSARVRVVEFPLLNIVLNSKWSTTSLKLFNTWWFLKSLVLSLWQGLAGTTCMIGEASSWKLDGVKRSYLIWSVRAVFAQKLWAPRAPRYSPWR